MRNPIINNRVAGGIHFAIRLLAFAEDMESSCACGEDEKESMIVYASELLEYQIQTATDKYELKYLEMNNASVRLEKAKQFLKII